jgi:site-specific DNA-methyltransferase (adenine-specific)
MKHINSDKQMTDVWRLPAIAPWEKSCGKHPTQKPLSVLSRLIMASTRHNAWILDPFAGSSTTGIAANLLGRKFLGIEKEEEFLLMSKLRREELNDGKIFKKYCSKIKDIGKIDEQSLFVTQEEEPNGYDLPF